MAERQPEALHRSGKEMKRAAPAGVRCGRALPIKTTRRRTLAKRGMGCAPSVTHPHVFRGPRAERHTHWAAVRAAAPHRKEPPTQGTALDLGAACTAISAPRVAGRATSSNAVPRQQNTGRVNLR